MYRVRGILIVPVSVNDYRDERIKRIDELDIILDDFKYFYLFFSI